MTTTIILDEADDTEEEPQDDGETKALVYGGLAAAATKEKKLISAILGAGKYATPGTSHRFRSPLDGRKLGQVLSTDPDPEWVVVDREALLAHLAETYPKLLETVYELHTPGGSLTLGPLDELTMVLLEHAPTMLNPVQRIPSSAVRDALAQSRATAKAAGPGIALVKAGSETRVLPDKNILEAVPAMIAAGHLRFEGTRPVLELPSVTRTDTDPE